METVGTWTRDWAEQHRILVQFLGETTSTNDLAKHRDDVQLIVSDHQTKGRGRYDRTWTDVGGKTLLSSWIFQSNKAPQPIAAPLIGLALYRTAKEKWPLLNFSLKAPNDLYVEGSKVGGLLLETVSSGHHHKFIVGLGINVHADPKVDLSGNLAVATGGSITKSEWEAFLNLWWSNLNKVLPQIKESKLTTTDCEELLTALNKNKLLTNPYSEVKPDGSLSGSGKTTSWWEI